MPRRALLRTGAVLAAGVSTGAAACTTGDDAPRAGADRGAGRGRPHEVVSRGAEGGGVLDPGTTRPGEAALAVSRAVLARSTAVVVSSTDPRSMDAGADVARRLGIPALVVDEGLETELEAELDRLGTRTVVRVAPRSGGSTATPAVPRQLGRREVVDAGSDDGLAGLPGLPRKPPGAGALVLAAEGAEVTSAAAATLAAVGARTTPLPQPDPRAQPEVVEALRAHPEAAVLGLAPALDAERFARRVRTARFADELPGGGLLAFPGRMMVALYGHPGTSSLGMLGEQSAEKAVRRARRAADEYAALTDVTVVPAFEIIATIASGGPGDDGDYSTSAPVSKLRPWVEAAERADTYVVLDLQPGRTHFLEQAKSYEELLRRPWVGLALDPEWRLGEDERHLEQIGSVDVDEVNEVGAWLAALVREHDLPPKVLTLHQFRPSMIRGRERLDTSLDEVQWVVHADGQGPQHAKQGTWGELRKGLPKGVWLGWKNFEHEDTPMLTPRQTLEQVRPTPQFISYQ